LVRNANVAYSRPIQVRCTLKHGRVDLDLAPDLHGELFAMSKADLHSAVNLLAPIEFREVGMALLLEDCLLARCVVEVVVAVKTCFRL
jgi:hypothetical protein